MKKIVLNIIIVFFFLACGSKQLYTLGDISDIKTTQTSEEFIAVARVKLPIYLMDSPIYRKNTPYHLEEIKYANWINSMDVHMTNVLISYLQKSMNNPNIYSYPWSNIKKMDKKVSVTISQFISYNNVISLDANYHTLDKNSKKVSNYIFHTKENIENDSVESMIKAMEKAYFRLANEIKDKL